MSKQADAVLALLRGPLPEGNPFDTRAFRALFLRARGETDVERSLLAAELLPGVCLDDPLRAGIAAYACSVILEWGADPRVAGRTVVERFARAAADRTAPPLALRYLGLAALAHFERSAALRREARESTDLVRALEAIAHSCAEATAVLELLRASPS